MDNHTPLRPEWICGGCGHPWPCADSRTRLRECFCDSRATLGFVMGRYFANAITDRPNWPDEGIYERMFSWIRR